MSDKASKPKKINAKRLENIALYYLQRYESSADNLRQVLMRRVNKAKLAYPDETNIDDCKGWIEDIVSKMQKYSYVDDNRYAENLTRALVSKGTSLKMMMLKMKQKGVPSDIIDKCIDNLEENNQMFQIEAAIKFARKKRFGMFGNLDKREDKLQKELATMARNGFPYDLSIKILKAECEEELEEMLNG